MEGYIREVFEERKLSPEQSEKLWRYYYDKLGKAVDMGYRPDFEMYDPKLAHSLKYNIAEFSAFKETSFRKQLEASLTENGRVLSWREFKQKADALHIEYNRRWLETEYNQTIATAQSAEKYQEYVANKHLYPNLKYRTIGDKRVREKHQQWDGLVLPVEDSFWEKHLPPNDWGCRCYVVPTAEPVSEYTKIDTPIKDDFANNPALTGKIFNNSGYLTSGGFNPETIEKILAWSHEMFRTAERYAKNYVSYLKYKKNKDYTNVLFDKKTGGMQATHKLHNFNKDTGKYEKFLRELFYKNGDSIILTNESSRIEGKKIDGFLNGKSFDISSILGEGKNTIKRALNHSKNKPAEVAILYFPNAENFSMERLENGINMYNGQTKYRFHKIIYIVGDVIRYY